MLHKANQKKFSENTIYSDKLNLVLKQYLSKILFLQCSVWISALTKFENTTGV